VDIQRDRSLVIFPGIKKKKDLRKITLKVDPAHERIFWHYISFKRHIYG
jgi:hypothetical protein